LLFNVAYKICYSKKSKWISEASDQDAEKNSCNSTEWKNKADEKDKIMMTFLTVTAKIHGCYEINVLEILETGKT
jgi:predicted  nucleic acid-binding Zn-ribbon protein